MNKELKPLNEHDVKRAVRSVVNDQVYFIFTRPDYDSDSEVVMQNMWLRDQYTLLGVVTHKLKELGDDYHDPISITLLHPHIKKDDLVLSISFNVHDYGRCNYVMDRVAYALMDVRVVDSFKGGATPQGAGQAKEELYTRNWTIRERDKLDQYFDDIRTACEYMTAYYDSRDEFVENYYGEKDARGWNSFIKSCNEDEIEKIKLMFQIAGRVFPEERIEDAD